MYVVLLAICSLLTNPNPENLYEDEIVKIYKFDKNKFNEMAKEWTMKFAMWSENSIKLI